MRSQVLSVEQVQHLKELGVVISSTNICWIRRTYNFEGMDNVSGEWSLSLPKEPGAIDLTHFEIVPTLTLQDMLEMIPENIGDCKLAISQYLTSYQYMDIALDEFCGEGILTNTYNTLCDLAKKRLLDSSFMKSKD